MLHNHINLPVRRAPPFILFEKKMRKNSSVGITLHNEFKKAPTITTEPVSTSLTLHLYVFIHQ